MYLTENILLAAMAYEEIPFYGDAPQWNPDETGDYDDGTANPPPYRNGEGAHAFPPELDVSAAFAVQRAMAGAPMASVHQGDRRRERTSQKRGRQQDEYEMLAGTMHGLMKTEDGAGEFGMDAASRAGSDDANNLANFVDNPEDALIDEAAEHFKRREIPPAARGASNYEKKSREHARVVGNFILSNQTMNGKAIPARTPAERKARNVLREPLTLDDEVGRLRDDTLHLVYYPTQAPSIVEAERAFRETNRAAKRARTPASDSASMMDAGSCAPDDGSDDEDEDEENSANCVLCYCTASSSHQAVKENWNLLLSTYINARLSSTPQMAARLVAKHFNEQTRDPYNAWRVSERKVRDPPPSEEDLRKMELPEITPKCVLRHFEKDDNSKELAHMREYLRLTEAIDTLPLWYVNMATGIQEIREHNIGALLKLHQLRNAVSASIEKVGFNSSRAVREILGLGSGK